MYDLEYDIIYDIYKLININSQKYSKLAILLY